MEFENTAQMLTFAHQTMQSQVINPRVVTQDSYFRQLAVFAKLSPSLVTKFFYNPGKGMRCNNLDNLLTGLTRMGKELQ